MHFKMLPKQIDPSNHGNINSGIYIFKILGAIVFSCLIREHITRGGTISHEIQCCTAAILYCQGGHLSLGSSALGGGGGTLQTRMQN